MDRPLGWRTLLALGINGVVGVGIFFAVPVVAKSAPGFWGLAVYAAVVLACLPIALVFGKLGARFSEDGGPYLYAKAAFGERTAFGIGWITYVSAVFSTATVATGFVEAVSPSLGVTGSVGRALFGAGFVSLLAFVLALGLRLSAWVWTTVTFAKLTPLFLLLGAALFALFGDAETAPVASGSAPTALSFMGAGMAVLFSLQGFEVVPLPAGQVRGSAFAVPLATVAALVFAGLLYMALHAACLLALPDLGARELPIAEAAAVFGGEGLGRLVRAGVSVSSLGITIGMVAMTPRYLSALGGEGGLFARVAASNERAIPVRAFVITWAAVVVVMVASFLYGSIGNLFALSTLSVLLQYAVTALSLALLAKRRERSLGPRDAIPVPFVLLACVWLSFGAEVIEILLVAVVIALGFLVRGLSGERPLRELGTP